jgi:DNA-binding NtrC family response regulator
VSGLADTIVGISPAMVALRDYLPKVARSRATVLITGATGTGKERLAHALHASGPRSRHPFVAINCAALPDNLIESELFGFERGAFTGAVSSSRGHIVRADGGSLFLDEIGEMSLHAQAKLLRTIESRHVLPVGGSREVAVDVRIIAATNQPLETLVERKAFRLDLYYRLNVARLELPPLHERREDIPVLFGDMVRELNGRENRAVGEPDAEFLYCLMAHDWPGNVRELRNLVEAIFIDPPDGRVRLDHLPPVFRKLFGKYRVARSGEMDHLLEVLQETNWNKAEAAKRLNWSRMTLYRKLEKYNIHRSC